jgi:hypothetical protein
VITGGQRVVVVAAQRRRNRSITATPVAPRCARPGALRDLYMDAGSLIRRTGPVTSDTFDELQRDSDASASELAD